MPEGPPQRQGAGRLNEREDLLPILRVIGSNSIDLCRKNWPNLSPFPKGFERGSELYRINELTENKGGRSANSPMLSAHNLG